MKMFVVHIIFHAQNKIMKILVLHGMHETLPCRNVTNSLFRMNR